jgi:hypothetical protein
MFMELVGDAIKTSLQGLPEPLVTLGYGIRLEGRNTWKEGNIRDMAYHSAVLM